MSIKHLDHLNLTVNNLEETIGWYAAVFGFTVVERGQRAEGPWAIIRSGESTLCVYEDPSRTAPHVFGADDKTQHAIYHVGFRITDRALWLRTAQVNNLQFLLDGEQRYDHSSSWYVLDPTGYTIEVVAWHDDIIRFGHAA